VLAKLQSFGSRVQQGTCCECVSLRLEAWFTTLTGSPSRLPETTFFDCAFVHLLSTATLDRLRALYPQGRFEVRRFRPNIAVETANDEKDFVEHAWIGQTLTLGDAVRLSVTGPCPRCVMTTLPQGLYGFMDILADRLNVRNQFPQAAANDRLI
jgi:uncharacterized protein YcbX